LILNNSLFYKNISLERKGVEDGGKKRLKGVVVVVIFYFIGFAESRYVLYSTLFYKRGCPFAFYLKSNKGKKEEKEELGVLSYFSAMRQSYFSQRFLNHFWRGGSSDIFVFHASWVSCLIDFVLGEVDAQNSLHRFMSRSILS
jgi:hypothetical protein